MPEGYLYPVEGRCGKAVEGGQAKADPGAQSSMCPIMPQTEKKNARYPIGPKLKLAC